MDYARVTPSFWTGKTGRAIRALGADAQVVAMYLLTSPHANMIGMYWLPVAYISADTGCPIEGASKALQSLIDAGFCRYCEESEMVWVLEMASYQIAESLEPKDKRVISINKMLKESQAPFVYEFFEKYGHAFHLAKPEGHRRGIEAPPKPVSSYQVTKDQKISPSDSSSASPDDPHPPGATGNVVSFSGKDGIPYESFASVFNEICGETFPQVVKLTDKRRKRIRTLWKTNTSDSAKDSARTDSLDYWRRYFAHCLTISFFTAERNGTGRDGWRPDFDFLTSEKGYIGVLEGKYV